MFSERSWIQKLLFLKAALAGGGSAIERTAIGNPLTFQTDLARPLKSLLIPFTPVQSGTGDPSPQNIRPIVPWNGLKVYHSGADTSNPTETDISFPSPVYGGTLDVVSGVLTVEYVTVDLGSLSWTYDRGRFYTNGLSNVIKRGSSARRLVMYCPIFLCISDGRSQANVPDMSIYEGGNGNVFIHDSDYTDKDTFKEAMDGIVLCYPIATPQEITLTPEQITALVGDNTIWSDADGSMTCVYLVSESFAENHPISGGLGSGLLGSGIGSGSEDPGEDQPEDPENPEGGE